jgi:hypothetical protein
MGAATGVDVGVAEAVAVAVANGGTVFAITEAGLSRLKPNTITNNKDINFRMGYKS